MKKTNFILHLTITFLMTLLVFSGCAKKVVKKEGTEGLKSDKAESIDTEAGGADEEKEPGIEDIIKEELEKMTGLPTDLEENRILGDIESERDQEKEKDLDIKISKLGQETLEGNGGDTGGIAGEGKGLLTIFFDFDMYNIRGESRETLKKNAVWLREHPEVKIMITGHADERGSNEYNLALGERRAKSTEEYLKDLGLNDRFKTISYGEEIPACNEHDEGCWSKNRRAEFVIVSE